jgi:hypothetical protein
VARGVTNLKTGWRIASARGSKRFDLVSYTVPNPMEELAMSAACEMNSRVYKPTLRSFYFLFCSINDVFPTQENSA